MCRAAAESESCANGRRWRGTSTLNLTFFLTRTQLSLAFATTINPIGAKFTTKSPRSENAMSHVCAESRITREILFRRGRFHACVEAGRVRPGSDRDIDFADPDDKDR